MPRLIRQSNNRTHEPFLSTEAKASLVPLTNFSYILTVNKYQVFANFDPSLTCNSDVPFCFNDIFLRLVYLFLSE